MASAPGVDGMVDIRSFAIFQDVSFNKNDCAHGVSVAAARGPFFRRFTHPLPTGTPTAPNSTNEQPAPTAGSSSLQNRFQQPPTNGPLPLQNRLQSPPHDCDCSSSLQNRFQQPHTVGSSSLPNRFQQPPLTVDSASLPNGFQQPPSPEQHSSPFFTAEEEGFEPPKVLDSPRSWLCCFCSVAVIFLIFGTLFSYGVLHRQIQLTYGLSPVEGVTVGAACLSIFVLIGPLATLVIKWLGFRSTAIFGLLLVFIGLLLEGFVSHVAIFYISRILCLPIGGGLAHTASHYMTSFFDEKIMYAVLILCASSTLGILAFSWFAAVLQTIIGYKGIQIIFAIIVLLLMTATHSFPMKLSKSVSPVTTKTHQIKTCIERSVKKDVMKRAGRSLGKSAIDDPNPDATAELKSCLCVCVCEFGTICNRGFFLWAGITMIGTLTFLIPYLFLYLFMSKVADPKASDTALKMIVAFCAPTLAARLYLLFFNDHTFLFNRSVFQIALAGTGVLFLLFYKMNSYGWLLVWMMVIGLCQGLISVTIPRVTLQTVAREWLKRAWVLIIVLNALGSFAGPIIMMSLRMSTLIIGILQIVATLLTFLIPNDEQNYKTPESAPAVNSAGTEGQTQGSVPGTSPVQVMSKGQTPATGPPSFQQPPPPPLLRPVADLKRSNNTGSDYPYASNQAPATSRSMYSDRYAFDYRSNAYQA